MKGYALNEIVLQAEKPCGYISSFFADFLEGKREVLELIIHQESQFG